MNLKNRVIKPTLLPQTKNIDYAEKRKTEFFSP